MFYSWLIILQLVNLSVCVAERCPIPSFVDCSCYNNSGRISCRNVGFTEIPRIPSNFNYWYIDLQYNNIKTLTFNISNVQLDLQNNPLQCDIVYPSNIRTDCVKTTEKQNIKNKEKPSCVERQSLKIGPFQKNATSTGKENTETIGKLSDSSSTFNGGSETVQAEQDMMNLNPASLQRQSSELTEITNSATALNFRKVAPKMERVGQKESCKCPPTLETDETDQNNENTADPEWKKFLYSILVSLVGEVAMFLLAIFLLIVHKIRKNKKKKRILRFEQEIGGTSSQHIRYNYIL